MSLVSATARSLLDTISLGSAIYANGWGAMRDTSNSYNIADYSIPIGLSPDCLGH